MASADSNHVDHVVELMEHDPSSSSSDAEGVSEQTTPLLIQAEVPKINIFTASYPRRKSRDEVTRSLESETSSMTQFILWVWNGSRYSGLLCMTLSSTIYFLMEVLSGSFSVQAIPLFETAFTRCTIILILSYLWLRRSEQPLFGTSQVRIILFSRALIGYLSLSSFVYCIQMLPFSQAIVLNLTTPVLASIMARVFWHEKLTIAEIAGLACSFFGVLFTFQEMLAVQGHLVKTEEGSNANSNSHIFAILLGLFSAITSGITYCLIRAGAKASSEPLLTIFAFGLLASPVTGICTFSFEDFVLPGFQSILLMLVLGVLAFFAEVMLARGLQLERTCKASNVLYLEAALSQVWRILALSKVAASLGIFSVLKNISVLWRFANLQWLPFIIWLYLQNKKQNPLKPSFWHFKITFLMLGTSVLIPSMIVPAMGGSDGDKAQVIQTLLFVAGMNTLLQALFGTRLPAVVGGSFAYIVPIAYIINDSSLQKISDSHERFIQTMRAIQGALIIASSIQIILDYSQVWGLFSRFFSPLGMAPVAGLVGLGLFQRGFPLLGNCVEIGLPMLLLVIGLSQYLKHVRPFREIPIFERFPVLICITIIWIYSIILTASGAYRHKPDATQRSCRTDRANLISTAPWFMFPYPLQWGPPTFNAGHAFATMSAVMVSMVESTAAYKAASRLAIATPPPAYVLSRGIGWQGIGILLDGLFGTGTGSTVSVENVGLLGLTRVGSRRVVQISAGFMIFFSTLGKFGAVFASIPIPIFAALYCILFGLVSSVGLSFLQFTNMNSMRNLIITGLTLFLGISIPQFFSEYWTKRGGLVHTNAGWFNAFLNTIFASPATVGLIVAVFLDNTMEVERSKKDRGMPWWVKFRTFRGDNRNEEFYTLPFNLNRFFPPT